MFESDWFTCSCHPNLIDLPPCASDSREDRAAQYAQRLNVATISIKRCILAKKTDIVGLVAEELSAFFADSVAYGRCRVTRQLKERVEFTIPCREVVGHEAFHKFTRSLREHLSNCVKDKWSKSVVFERGTLQALLMAALKTPSYRLHASVHHAGKHGASKTLDVLDPIDHGWARRF